MKKGIKFMGLTFLCSFFGMQVALAAPSVSTSVSSSTIEKGSNVTFYVTIKNVASWNVKINGTGSTSGCSTAQADATSNGNNTTKTFSITCKGTDIGLINFSLSGDATSSDGSNVNLSGNKRVNVTAVKPKSTNNYLKSIRVGEYSLSPEFSKETMEYSVTVPSTVNSINLEATLEDGTASMSGTGEKEVDEGINSFEIKVNAQNGDERIYKVNVLVEDQNPIQIKIQDKEYTIIKNAKNVTKPDLYEMGTIQIGDFEVPSFVSDVTGYTLVAVKDSDGVIHFAIYDEKEHRYQLYQEVKSPGLIVYIMEPTSDYDGFYRSDLEIDGVSYNVFKMSDTSDFVLVYGMNVETGETGYFLYDTKEKTFQRYFDEMNQLLREENKKYKDVILGFAGVCVVLVLICMFSFLRKPKKKHAKKQKESLDLSLKEEMKKKVKKEDADQEVNVEPANDISNDKKSSKKGSKKSKKNSSKKELKDIPTDPSIGGETSEIEVEDAMKKMLDAEKMIQDYEKTVSISKEEIEREKKKQEHEVPEETMFDLFEDEKKKKKRKK